MSDLEKGKEGAYEGLVDPLAVSVKIGEQAAAGEKIDWAEVLKSVGVMRSPEGAPMPGASELGATAVSMIAAEQAQKGVNEGVMAMQGQVDAMQRTVDEGGNVARGLTSAVSEGNDVYMALRREVQNLDDSAQTAQRAATNLDGVVARGERVASTLGSVLDSNTVYRLEGAAQTISDAADRAYRSSQGGY